MTAPTFVSSTATAFNTSTIPKTTASIAVQNGDVLVATGMCESAHGASGDTVVTIATASGSTSIWTLQEDTSFADSNHAYVKIWTATATATGNITVTFDRTDVGNTLDTGGVVKVWRDSNGIGAINKNNNDVSSGAPTISISTGNNSGLDFSSADWNGTTGTVTFTASNGTPVSDVSDQTASAHYCVYSSHVVDAGAAGSKTMGMSAPSTQRYVAVVVEVLGIASASAPVAGLIIRGQAVKRASYW